MSRVRLILIGVALTAGDGRAAEPGAEQPVSFGQDIQPLLSKRCFACHGPDGEEGLVRFDKRDELVEQRAVVPGKPEESELLARVTSTDPHERMPPKGDPLSAAEVDRLRRWIAEGAKFERHWAFRPPTNGPPPAVADATWPRNSIDRFVLAKLEQAGLRPAPEADRPTLIRRLTFDLTGLPPTPEEIDAFVADRTPAAYERLVDRLLSSPHYGERAAQHWLDVVRFAETEGFEYDRLLVGAWRYRDYVIDAFNADLPFDRFVTEQLAGDELDPNDPRLQIAVGLHRLGPVRRNAGNADVAMSRNEVLTTRTDVIGSAFLGLTLGCARCHDHKFDPIPQRDYYRLQAFLAATDEHDVVLVSDEDRQAWQKRTDAINGEIKKLTESQKSAEGGEAREIQSRIEALNRDLPPPLPSITSVRNRDKPTPIHVLGRGEEGKKGERVEMGLPSLLAPTAAESTDAAATPAESAAKTTPDPRPRTHLARRLVDPSNPLVTRVIVNRLWQQHFGTGLVATANDFGLHGEPPSHPELLDHLAVRFAADGHSVKAMHRLIITSATYRQGSRSPVAEAAGAKDPDNRLLWHHRPGRLDAEALRDAMLAISGRLNPKRGGESVVVPVDAELTALLYKPSQWTVTADGREHDRRSIYLLAKRNLRLPFLEAFDQPSLQNSCARRESSTHAPQALELLNGRWSNDLAASFAERLIREVGDRPEQQVERGFLLGAGRPPTAEERRLSLEFLRKRSLREFALALFNLNAFLYVD
jgi:mono/diheme cytochrome c family protein